MVASSQLRMATDVSSRCATQTIIRTSGPDSSFIALYEKLNG